ncbi:MAG: molybdate ABC transporter substrate-binding protein [Actinomycetota bacterium]|nr:molybdate ABC transporter substrate-binding protein [Actinomycetota bacterium]
MKKRFGLFSAVSMMLITVFGPIASQAVPTPAASPAPTGSITVSAAASLTDVFPVIANAFMKKYPGTTVKFNFAGSSTLVQQIIAGAPVDVLATASEPTMWTAVSAGRVGTGLLFAKNTMAIAMPLGNPAKIAGLSSLSRNGVLVAECAVTVPCGAAARDLLAKNGVTVKPVTLELDVRSVLAKVMAGEVDAGIVYVTDVKSVGSKLASIAIPNELNITTTYPIAAVKSAANPTAARAFVNYVRFTPSAQGILRAYGFARPW